MHRFDFTFEVKSLGDDGTFEGYASTFGNKDSGGDVIMPGAFAKSIRTKGVRGVKMLLDHDPRQRACAFHVMVGTVSSGWWAVIPRDRGQSFHRMVGAHST
jgi:hypothetical protein